MDYIFLSSLKGVTIVRLVMSYDIACQWSIHLWEHMAKYSESIWIDPDSKEIVFLVPKFHLPAHIAHCQTTYSFNLTPGVGHTDGEAPK